MISQQPLGKTIPEGRTSFLPFYRPWIDEREISEVVDTLRSGWLTMGPKTIQFEEKFGAYVGAKHALAVNSCTAGLHLALDVAGIQPGDEVITSPYTFAATANVVLHLKARPVLADVVPDTMLLDPADVARKITPRTRAVIPVHIAGAPCDMDPLLELAARHKLVVIEDAAHALPTRYKGRMVGSIGDLSVFSFYAGKNLTTGEGGMVTTESDEYAERLRTRRLHGISRDAWKRYTAEGSWYYEIGAGAAAAPEAADVPRRAQLLRQPLPARSLRPARGEPAHRGVVDPACLAPLRHAAQPGVPHHRP